MSQQFYTIEEIAKMLRVSEATVRNLISSGELPAAQVGRQWRISQADLDKYLEEQKKRGHS